MHRHVIYLQEYLILLSFYLGSVWKIYSPLRNWDDVLVSYIMMSYLPSILHKEVPFLDTHTCNKLSSHGKIIGKMNVKPIKNGKEFDVQPERMKIQDL